MCNIIKKTRHKTVTGYKVAIKRLSDGALLSPAIPTVKYKVGKVVKYGAAVINVVNPVFWFRKLVINTSVDVMTRKVCLVVIGIVGEETTTVYSKKLFDKPVELNVVEQEMLSLLEEGVEE